MFIVCSKVYLIWLNIALNIAELADIESVATQDLVYILGNKK